MGMNKFETVGPQFTNLTDSTGGTASATTLEDVAGLTISGTYAAAEVQALRDAVANNLASLAAKIDEMQDGLNKAN